MNRFVVALLGASLVAACGQVGPIGPPGPEGPPGPGMAGGASISSITPNRVLLGRATQVSISGFATEWTGAAQVSFGADVTVEGITAASPTGIVARIVVSENAAVGARDVTVTEGGKVTTYKGGFSLVSPLEFPAGTTLAQGDIKVVEVKNLDFGSALDTTTDTGGNFVNLTFSSDSVFGSITSASPFGASILLVADVTAPPGDAKVTIESGATTPKTKFVNPKAFTVTARTPTALTAGTPVTGTVTNALETHLYSITSSSDAIVTVNVSSTNTDARPRVFGIPTSGKIADSVGYAAQVTVVAMANQPVYFLYWDQTQTAGYDYTLNVTSVATSVVPAEIEPNDTTAQAQSIASAPFLIQSADYGDITDIDYYAVTVGAGDVGKRLRVRTLPGDAAADPVVEVLATDGLTSLGGPSDDANYHEDFLSDAITAAGVHYIKVYVSSYVASYEPTESHYQLSVTLE